MDSKTLRDNPHLPLLTLEQCLAVFGKAKIGFSRLALLAGVSRMSVYLWRRGRTPHAFAQDRVSTLAYKALVGVRSKVLPLPARCKFEQLQATLDGIDLAGMTAEQLLPQTWIPTQQ